MNSRNKGSKAERDVAAMLAAWWDTFEPGVRFVKTPLSGGWSTAQVRGEFRASGDLMTTSATFPFVVEVKRREGFAWSTLLAGRRSPVWQWWEQTCKAATEQRGAPMLWLRHNREPWHVGLAVEVLARLEAERLVSGRFVRARGIPAPAGEFSILSATALLAVPADRIVAL
jgi:hypothetical protein